MDAEQEKSRSDSKELVDWLIEQIDATTYMERLKFIAETIAADRESERDYLTAEALATLREVWHRKQQQLDSKR